MKITTLSEVIKNFRKENGLSVTNVAYCCGVSPRTVEGWEQGRRPSKQSLALITRMINGSDTEM